MVFQGTGQEIVVLSPTYPGLLAFCTEDYLNIFRKNRLYARNAENTNWMEQTAVRHLHNTDSDSSGGQLVDILIANAYQTYILDMTMVTPSMFGIETGGAAFVNAYADGTAIDLTAQAGDYGNMYIRGAVLGCDKNFVWAARTSIDTSQRTSVKLGVGAEKVQSFNDDTLNKALLESCDQANVSRNWNLASADGIHRDAIGSATPVSVPGAYTAQTVYVNSGDLVKFVYEGGLTTAPLIKTTSVPTTSVTDFRTWNFGYKSNGSATASAHISMLKIYGYLGVPL
jgi:hypothetical protein